MNCLSTKRRSIEKTFFTTRDVDSKYGLCVVVGSIGGDVGVVVGVGVGTPQQLEAISWFRRLPKDVVLTWFGLLLQKKEQLAAVSKIFNFAAISDKTEFLNLVHISKRLVYDEIHDLFEEKYNLDIF